MYKLCDDNVNTIVPNNSLQWVATIDVQMTASENTKSFSTVIKISNNFQNIYKHEGNTETTLQRQSSNKTTTAAATS